MFKENFLGKFGIADRFAIMNIVLISNAFIWYFIIFSILKTLIVEMPIVLWSVHFAGAIISALIGAKLSERVRKRTFFLLFWIMLGVISSLILTFASFTSIFDILLMSLFSGMSFGIGVPTSLGYFAEHTAVEYRARLGGLILSINGIGTFLLGLGISSSITLNGLILAAWRLSGLIIFILLRPFQEKIERKRNVSFGFILYQRPFVTYFLPWVMFSLVNYLSAPVLNKLFTLELIETIVTIENILAGIFAIIGGFLSDFLGRKRVAIIGFVMLGLGYAILGTYPENLSSWYFYTLMDSIAWGFFHVIFIFAVWGDLCEGISSEKYYAIGGLPFYVSNFLRILIGSYIAEAVAMYAIFSFTSLFMFIAILPLMFAPETLPERKIRERELRGYIERAKRIREKFTKG